MASAGGAAAGETGRANHTVRRRLQRLLVFDYSVLQEVAVVLVAAARLYAEYPCCIIGMPDFFDIIPA